MFLVLRPLIDTCELAAWARSQGFHDLVPATWHVTVINSRVRLNSERLTLDGKTSTSDLRPDAGSSAWEASSS